MPLALKHTGSRSLVSQWMPWTLLPFWVIPGLFVCVRPACDLKLSHTISPASNSATPLLDLFAKLRTEINGWMLLFREILFRIVEVAGFLRTAFDRVRPSVAHLH